MSVVTSTICDVPVRNAPHGAVASTRVELVIGNKKYGVDICDEHIATLETAMAKVGFQLTSGKVDSKQRKAQKTKSGKAYTTADARAWLIEHGELDAGKVGRIPKSKEQIFVDAN